MITKYPFVPYRHETYSESEMIERSKDFHAWMELRRTVRDFSEQNVPQEILEQCVLAASTAPSGAHKQPWTFCLVSRKDAELRKSIRAAAEEEEYNSYQHRMTQQWLEDLAPLGTDHHKPFLETAPWLIVVFKKVYDVVDGEKRNNYYVNESVGLACGMLLTALHHVGLVALTHTPSPMNFLTTILKRPQNERPFLLIPVGYAHEDATVPDLQRKSLDEVTVYY